MSAYKCCGGYDEHEENCELNKQRELNRVLNERLSHALNALSNIQRISEKVFEMEDEE